MEPLSALFMMIVSWMISFFRVCLCLYIVLCLGFSGICNVFSTSSLMSSTFTGVCGSGGIVVESVACFCRWLVVYCVEFCVYLFGVCRSWA